MDIATEKVIKEITVEWNQFLSKHYPKNDYKAFFLTNNINQYTYTGSPPDNVVDKLQEIRQNILKRLLD